MKRLTLFLLLALLGMTAYPMEASAHGARAPVVRGRVFVAQPFWYGGGWYFPGPFYEPFGYPITTGSIKIDTNAKDAAIYVNGAYAGTVRKLKTFDVKSGTYDIEVRNPDGSSYRQQVFVPVGKRMVISPVFSAPTA